MSLKEELFPASLDGASFYMTVATTTGGRKTVTHEFVNSSVRNVEDLGPLQKVFSVTGVISGDNYTRDRNALIAALEKGGKLILIHPLYGRVEVVAKPYTVREDITRLGEAAFDMTFERAEDIIRPQAAQSGLSKIASQSAICNAQLAADVGDEFTVSNAFLNSYDSAITLINDVASSFEAVTELFAPGNAAVTELSSALQDLKSDASDLLSQPIALGNGVLNLFDTALSITDDAQAQVDTIKKLFSFNSNSDNLSIDTETAGNTITAEQAEIVTNEKALTRQMQISALSAAYAATSRVEFSNIADLDNALALLEDQYDSVIDDKTLPVESREALQTLRDLVEIFIQQQRVTVNRITEIEVKEMPMQLIGYLLYGDLNNTNALIDLNNTADVSHVSGNIRVLTE